jgi:serine/threonine protein phosphatase PrpC
MQTTALGTPNIGQRRERNEDAFRIDDELSMYTVCDGMGGHVSATGAVVPPGTFVNARIED